MPVREIPKNHISVTGRHATSKSIGHADFESALEAEKDRTDGYRQSASLALDERRGVAQRFCSKATFSGADLGLSRISFNDWAGQSRERHPKKHVRHAMLFRLRNKPNRSDDKSVIAMGARAVPFGTQAGSD